jgi:hypothetical protein
MRDRESVDLERKNVIRNLEKQAKVIERLADSEKNLQQQIVRYFLPPCLSLVSYRCRYISGSSRIDQPAPASNGGRVRNKN